MSKNKVDEQTLNSIFNSGINFRQTYVILDDKPIMNKYSECRIFVPKNNIIPELLNVIKKYPEDMKIIDDIGGMFEKVFCTKNTKLNTDKWAMSDKFGGYIMPGTQFYYFVSKGAVDEYGKHIMMGYDNLEDFENIKKTFEDMYNVKKLNKQYIKSGEDDIEYHLIFDIYKFTPKKGAKRTKDELLSEAEELRKEIKQTKIPAVKQTEEVPKLIKQAGSKIKRNKMVSDIEKLLADMGELKSKVHPDKKISKLISEAEAIVKQKRKVKGKGIEDSMAKAMPGLVQMFSLFK